ncbi:hypothetical protein COU59_02250 [Candidatus Pacearchaeota archaeon CG10_big_fil_rev_8_21_14_0_10_34_12]|nr:MAG: hypothetical protein COU59_02250 [Candidatus Pacearchaeota archaeon CG10_big_fil_rev_8_21_14_0_10_34_12]
MIKKNKKVFSHSRISTFEQCKLKYKYRYIDNIIPDIEKTIESHLGSVVHKTLEWVYTLVKNKNPIPSLDEVIIYYSNAWKKDYEPEIPIVRKNNGVDFYFNKGIQFLIDYYMRHKPFDDNTLEVEQEILLDLDEEGEYKIRGFIDRLSYNLKTEEYEIHDYKTSARFPSEKDIENDRQLALYSIAIKNKFGHDKKVILIWHYLSFNRKLRSKRTDEQLKKLKEKTLGTIKEIEETQVFPPTKSKLCDWCEFKDICPVWGNKPPEKQLSLEEYYRIKERKKRV